MSGTFVAEYKTKILQVYKILKYINLSLQL